MRLACLALLAACAHALPPTMVPAGGISYRTEDGWINEIRHFPGDGPPVLLVHGMAANHYNFDFRPEVSLAAYLQEAGWDVWVPELRGDPGSQCPEGAATNAYTFDDHARFDLPAAVDAVLASTGEPRLYWVGHSMGGMLLYTALSTYPERIAAGVAISSPVSFDDPIPSHKAAAGAGFLVAGKGVLPLKGLGRMAVDLGLARALEGQLSSRDSMSGAMLRGLALNVLMPVPKPMARQAVGWLKTGGLTAMDGRPWMGGNTGVPLLVMAGSMDHVVSEADVSEACEHFSPCQYIQLSDEGGFSHDYGHIDPVVGRTARVEVYPRVLRFLEAARTEAVADGATR